MSTTRRTVREDSLPHTSRRTHLRLTAEHASDLPENLEGDVLLLVLHILPDFPYFLGLLKKRGLRPERTFIAGIPYSANRVAVSEAEDLGFEVEVAPSFDAHMNKVIPNVIEAAVRRCQELNSRLTVVEDGGYVLPYLHRHARHALARTRGIVEQTRRGVITAEEIVKETGLQLEFPLVSVPSTRLKKEVEAIWIGDAVLSNLKNLLGRAGRIWRGQRFLVFGFGAIGSRVATALKSIAGAVRVYDIDPLALLRACMEGFGVGTLDELVPGSDVLIGCSVFRITFEWARVDYSNLEPESNILLNALISPDFCGNFKNNGVENKPPVPCTPDPEQMARFEIDDVVELHLGLEYQIRSHPKIILRAGAWLDPDHQMRYELPERPKGGENQFGPRFAAGEDEVHLSGGFGIVPLGERYQIDFAFDLSDRADTVSLSTVYRWR